MPGFDPFRKPLSQLTMRDLQRLADDKVAEGMSIEYKQDWPPDNCKVAHSIASFANSHGGWYLLGVSANNEENTPERFPGICVCGTAAPADRLRDIVVGHVTPIPRLGDSALVDVGGGRRVLVQHVPEGDDTPYVCNDGRTYRRNGAGSDPVPETDRHTMDRLFERRQNHRARMDMFCAGQPGVGHVPSVEVYAIPDRALPTDVAAIFANSDRLREHFRRKKKFYIGEGDTRICVAEAGFPITAHQAASGSLVFEQRGTDAPIGCGLRLEVFRDARLRVTINGLPISPNAVPCQPVEHAPQDGRLARILRPLDPLDSRLRVVDGGAMLGIVLCVIASYILLLEEAHWEGALSFRYRLRSPVPGVWYFGYAAFEDQCKSAGVPLVREQTMVVPSDDRFFEIGVVADEPSAYWRPIMEMIGVLLSALGILPEATEGVVFGALGHPELPMARSVSDS